MSLSATAFLEKNKLSTTKAWIILVQLTMPDTTVLRVCMNNENVTWPVTAGDLYTAFPFDIDETMDDSKGEVPSITLKVSNVTRILEPYLETQEGLVDSEVEIYVVNSTKVTTPSQGAGVNNNNPEIELNFDVLSSNADAQWVYFILGAMNPWNKRFPRNKVYKNICRYYDFGGDRCQYAGAETTCDRSLDTCRNTMDNSINFGGFPGVGTTGEYV